MTIFTERLRLLMDERGITAKELVEEGLISKNNIRNWENGTTPQFNTIVALANRFGVTTDYLRGISDERTVPSSALEGIDFALSGEIRDMSENEKQDLLDYIRFKKSQRRDKNDA